MYLLLFAPFIVILLIFAATSPVSIGHLYTIALLGIFMAAFWWLVSRKTINLLSDTLRQGNREVPLGRVRGVSYDVMTPIFTARGRVRLVFTLTDDTITSINIAGFSQGQINNLLGRLVEAYPNLSASIGQAGTQTQTHHKVAKYIGLALLAACVGYIVWTMLTV